MMRFSGQECTGFGLLQALILCMSGMGLLDGAIVRAADAEPVKPTVSYHALALEAEDFTVEKGWKVIRNGQGNYMVDIIGFNHISGERLLSVDEKDATASALMHVTIPADGDYTLWVRYEYPAFCEARFEACIEQGGKKLATKIMGTKTSPRLGFGSMKLTAQHDPSWGPEGLFEEPMDVPMLKAGKATIILKSVEQPLLPGVSAHRNIDLVFLTNEPLESWFKRGGGAGYLYPLLNVYRDARGPRYEAAIINRGDKPVTAVGILHHYNRVPWAVNENSTLPTPLPPGQTSDFFPIKMQDTTHFSMVTFTVKPAQSFEVKIRAIGRQEEMLLKGDSRSARVYLPAYPGKDEQLSTPTQAIASVLKLLSEKPAPGRIPTQPLCYGGCLPLNDKGEYGKAYGELYKAIGMRGFPSTNQNAAIMQELGLPLNRSAAVSAFRQPPTPENIIKAKATIAKNGLTDLVSVYDYGDEISFETWVNFSIGGKKELLGPLWVKWYEKKYPGQTPPATNPDSSASAARNDPKLYVNSLRFYEETAIEYMANCRKMVKESLGENVLCGDNYSAHPFYFPTIAMYVKWFRGGAGDFGRHSEYFWQACQAGPMINGYLAEHFRTGMRFNDKAIHRQYTMPHSPGNSEGSFIRTAFTHLAHGAKELDFFGIGMNETFTENHIDHRDHDRYRQIRDVTHSLGLVEDGWLDSKLVPAQAAILISQSTERWDLAAIAKNGHELEWFGEHFRATRLHHHMERVGIWKAMTFAGASPDLLIEEDIQPEILKGYKLLVIVGDSLPAAMVTPLEAWVRNGGVIFATAGAGRFDEYRQPNAVWQKFLGIESAKLDERATFLRPRMELPYEKPITKLVGGDWAMPVIGVVDRFKMTSDGKMISEFSDDHSPALMVRELGKGKIYYSGAMPGLAYLWSGLQPPVVPDRSPSVHVVPSNYDAGAAAILKMTMSSAGVEPVLKITPELVDARLVKTPWGYAIPLANYQSKVGGAVRVKVALPTNVKVTKVISAYLGNIIPQQENGHLVVDLATLGYGDMLRIEAQ